MPKVTRQCIGIASYLVIGCSVPNLELAGFRDVKGYGFGLYPFPNFSQPILEKIDPCHCHQMVLVAKKIGTPGGFGLRAGRRLIASYPRGNKAGTVR
ncbi:MAG: hypothetical protein ACI8XZ_002438 [Gammaproteobacteria bacterium]|jgi:hypothetical protein